MESSSPQRMAPGEVPDDVTRAVDAPTRPSNRQSATTWQISFRGDAMTPVRAAALASATFWVPLALGASSSPSPNHPRIFLWYRSLRTPAFKPPDWVIPLTWFGIEASLATAAYRLLRSPATPARNRALGWLSWNVVAIGGWSELFFKQRALPLSTVAAASMVATGTQFVRESRRVDPVAARAGVPFVAWVSFATLLTGTLWHLNRRRSS
jgi:benzodiazapine receptor